MKQINPENKKGEHEALLYKLEVKLNSDGDVLFNYDWVKPETLIDRLKNCEHKYTLSAIIRHCLSNGYKLDEDLKYLLRNI